MDRWEYSGLISYAKILMKRADEFLNSESTKRATKPAADHELYTDDRDCMRVEQAVDTDTKGFGGEPIEDNIDSDNTCKCIISGITQGHDKKGNPLCFCCKLPQV